MGNESSSIEKTGTLSAEKKFNSLTDAERLARERGDYGRESAEDLEQSAECAEQIKMATDALTPSICGEVVMATRAAVRNIMTEGGETVNTRASYAEHNSGVIGAEADTAYIEQNKERTNAKTLSEVAERTAFKDIAGLSLKKAQEEKERMDGFWGQTGGSLGDSSSALKAVVEKTKGRVNAILAGL